MKKGLGIFLTLAGLVATVITGMNAMQDSDSFSVLGMDVVVSKADYTPLIISVVVLVMGVILWVGSGRRR